MAALASLTAHELGARYRSGEATPTQAATEYLANEHGIPAAEARPNLRRVVAEYAREQSYELRNEAVAYEQEGAYDLALDCYQRAAWWQEEHDAKDYQFLQR